MTSQVFLSNIYKELNLLYVKYIKNAIINTLPVCFIIPISLFSIHVNISIYVFPMLLHHNSFFHAFDIAIFILRSEEHTSELQSRFDIVCRLLLETKKIEMSMLVHPPKLTQTV